MPNFSHTPFYDGQTPTASDFNQNWTDLEAVVNDNLDRLNIKTQWAEMAITFRAERVGYGSPTGGGTYQITAKLPTRAGTAPTAARILGMSLDLADTSGSNSVQVDLYSGTVSITSGTVSASSSTNYIAAGGTSQVDPTNDLIIKITATSDFVSGDALTVVVYLATQLMSQTEVES